MFMKSQVSLAKRPPSPLLNLKTPVKWWSIFKFDAGEFEEGRDLSKMKKGIFDKGGLPRPKYLDDSKKRSQRFAVASESQPTLQMGKGVLGTTLDDPLGATFGQVYNSSPSPFNYVLWNDDFYGHPIKSVGSGTGHSKGMLAWDNQGDGVVLQVSTPSWPGSGSKLHPRQNDGNTLGFVDDDNLEFSQHFFALKVNTDDVSKILTAMRRAKVNTSKSSDPSDKKNFHPELMNLNKDCPDGLRKLVNDLSSRKKLPDLSGYEELSSGVKLISKSPDLHVPPWQMVSAKLTERPDLRVATWWTRPEIYSTTKSSGLTPKCWDKSLKTPGAVEIATSGVWVDPGNTKGKKKVPLSFLGMGAKTPSSEGGEAGKHHKGNDYNHAKLGVSTSKGTSYTIFGDMNQQGTFGGPGTNPKSSQNGRGGMFFAVSDKKLFASFTQLLKGTSAPTKAPPAGKKTASNSKSKKKNRKSSSKI